jgi:hypothetical protein
MDIKLPLGWERDDSKTGDLQLKFQRTYSDGTDVIVEIKKSGGFEVWSSAAHRCSGPIESKESEHRELNSAIISALAEMSGWDRYLEKHS